MRNGMTTSEAGKLGALAAAETIAVKKQARIDAYNKNPKLCLYCNSTIPYDKDRRSNFCNHSCSAKYHNETRMGFVLAENKTTICLHCKNEFKTTGLAEHKYCSRKCMFDFHWAETKNKLLTEGTDNSSGNAVGKKYLIELHEDKCQLCKLDKWQGQKMPLVLDHVDGNAYNNLLSNLRVICNNCDALQPTFKSRNKGNGRFKRAERYKKEKEILGEIEGFKWKH